MDRLSPQDLITLWPEQVGQPQDIGAVAVLDGSDLLRGIGGVDVDVVRDLVASRLHLTPRLRQIVHTHALGLGRPAWVDASTFDLGQHVRTRAVPAPGSDRELMALVECLRRCPLDPSRPLWEMWLLPGLGAGRIGLYLRVHHVLADGPSVVSMLGTILAPAPTTLIRPAQRWVPGVPPAAHEVLLDDGRRIGAALSRGCQGVVHPAVLATRTRAVAAALRSAGLGNRAPASSLNRPIGSERAVAIVRGDLDLIRAGAHRREATVNDVLLTAVTAGLRALLRERGEPVDTLVLRAVVPIALPHRGSDRQHGNVLGQMIVSLPLSVADPAECLRRIADETAKKKQLAAPRRPPVLRSHAMQRAAMRVAGRQRAYNVYIANIRGPESARYLLDAEVLDVSPVVPLMGNLTLGVGALSYGRRFNVVAVADRTTCPDLLTFAEALERALTTMS